eukprot:29695-Pelagococcus_subviridis.AAC.3
MSVTKDILASGCVSALAAFVRRRPRASPPSRAARADVRPSVHLATFFWSHALRLIASRVDVDDGVLAAVATVPVHRALTDDPSRAPLAIVVESNRIESNRIESNPFAASGACWTAPGIASTRRASEASVT